MKLAHFERHPNTENHYLKLVEAKIDQHVIVPWEPHVLLPMKHPLGLFNLFHTS
jgi:hypothetical protein